MEYNPVELKSLDWEGKDSHVLINPRIPDYARIHHDLKKLPVEGHLVVATSGSRGEKWVLLSKKAILTSASAVNERIELSSADSWAHPLPDFHVGGIGVWARCHLAGIEVHDFKETSKKWDAGLFTDFLDKRGSTITSLVPTMLYDLVSKHLTAPSSLRLAVIGGGKLDKTLRKKAENLGWRCVESYGMTECASQVASAPEPNDELTLYSHVKAKINEDGFICIKSPSLFTGYIQFGKELSILDPRKEGWFQTEDLGQMTGNTLKILGRRDDYVKIGGEGISMYRLEEVLTSIKYEFNIKTDMTLVAVPDERLGHKIVLAVINDDTLKLLMILEEFQKRVMPFARVREVVKVEKIPRSHLHKVQKNELLRLVSMQQGSNASKQIL